MKNWLNSLSTYQYAFFVGTLSAICALLAGIVLNSLFNFGPTAIRSGVVGGFIGGFISILIVKKEPEK